MALLQQLVHELIHLSPESVNRLAEAFGPWLYVVLFGIISLTAVFLVLAIFWAMVSEKTKDIGVLRAIGASRPGVAGLWLSYGLAIGVGLGLHPPARGVVVTGANFLRVLGHVTRAHPHIGFA